MSGGSAGSGIQFVPSALPEASPTEGALGGFGVGTDGRVLVGVHVVELSRVATIIERRPFVLGRCFTKDERAACEAMPQPLAGYAARLAAKFAVCKALKVGAGSVVSLGSIEVSQGAKGRFFARPSGHVGKCADELGVLEIPLSFSYTHSEAAACAMAITQDSVNKAKERVDQRAELNKRFREARSMLDELAVPEQAPDQASLPGIR